jgi:hypothetical protein
MLHLTVIVFIVKAFAVLLTVFIVLGLIYQSRDLEKLPYQTNASN